MDNPIAPLPDRTEPHDGAPPMPAFAGRTPTKGSAIRAGTAVGVALLVVVGSAVAMGAAPRQSSTGADPQVAAASGSPAPERSKDPKGGKPRAHDGFGGLFWLGGRLEKVLGHGFRQVTITAIDGSSISLATEDGWTRTIELTASTTITLGGAAATRADLEVGDQVRFRQQRNDDGTFTITAIDVVLPMTVGTIESTGDGTLTITDRDGATVTVHLGSSTAIRVRGVENATAKDLSKGQVVVVVGERRADDSIDATGVLAGKLGGFRLDKPKHERPKASTAPSASGQSG